jgi:hypothetical protein
MKADVARRREAAAVASAVTGERSLAIAIGAVVFAMFVALWFAFPQWRAAQARLRKR